jgi:hypothetical protein
LPSRDSQPLPSCSNQIGDGNDFSDSRSLISLPASVIASSIFLLSTLLLSCSFAEKIAGRCATDANHFTLLQFGEMSVHWSPILKSEGIFHSVLKVGL